MGKEVVTLEPRPLVVVGARSEGLSGARVPSRGPRPAPGLRGSCCSGSAESRPEGPGIPAERMPGGRPARSSSLGTQMPVQPQLAHLHSLQGGPWLGETSPRLGGSQGEGRMLRLRTTSKCLDF